MIVELRSTGAQTLVSPSTHPSGEEYDRLDVEPATVPAPMLAACVKAIADAVIVRRGGSVIADKPTSPPLSPIDASDVETRAIAYLAAMPPAVSGSGGHSQTYAAATALVHGFGIDPDRALARVTGSGDTFKYEYESTFSKVRNASAHCFRIRATNFARIASDESGSGTLKPIRTTPGY
ncbi:hypothetical protein U8335_10665 [Roseiconus lacunae]|uniref:hypothetical protein n=1 Tax=Roseiconus lacunae TaxID=2605694 RepID=UPI00308AAAB0|nr:hypothetical protein U8335_10665 [Stieleria sp. HD01]